MQPGDALATVIDLPAIQRTRALSALGQVLERAAPTPAEQLEADYDRALGFAERAQRKKRPAVAAVFYAQSHALAYARAILDSDRGKARLWWERSEAALRRVARQLELCEGS